MQLRFALLLGLASCLAADDPDGGMSNNNPDGSTGGSADAAIGGDATGGSTCTITLTGDLTGTLPCMANAGKRDVDDFSIVAGMSTRPMLPVSTVAFSVFVEGEVAVADYPHTVMRSAAAMLQTNDQRSYTAALTDGQLQGTIGVLHITSLDISSTEGGMKVWKPHGTFSATLVGVTGGGSTTMEVAF